MKLLLFVLCLFIAVANSYILSQPDSANANNVMSSGAVHLQPVDIQITPMGGSAFDGGMYGGSAMMDAVKSCYGPLVTLWHNMTDDQRSNVIALLQQFKFDEAKVALESAISTLPQEDQSTTNQWIEDNWPPKALTDLFSNLSEDERAKLQSAMEGGSSGIMTMISIFRPHFDNLTSEDQSTITDYIMKQMKCISGSLMRSRAGNCNSGFNTGGNQWSTMNKPAVGSASVDVMPYSGPVNVDGSNTMMIAQVANKPNIMIQPIAQDQLVNNANGVGMVDPSSNVNSDAASGALVRPMNPFLSLQVANTNQKPLTAPMLQSSAQQIGGRFGARPLASRRKRRSV